MNEDLIHLRFNQAKQLGCNFAAMRLPKSNDAYYFYASEVPKMQRVEYQKTLDRPIFVCSPYSAGDKAYTFVSDAVYKNNTCIFGQLPPQNTGSLGSFYESESNQNFYADETFYNSYVTNIISNITGDKFDKVVAARCENLHCEKAIDAVQLFIDATNKYPDAAVYFFSINGVGSWIGATPEKLLSVTNNAIETVALAGTLPTDDSLSWTDKEYDEQGMIEFFIRNVFKQHGFKRFTVSDVETITAGNVSHLRSVFNAKLTPDILQVKLHKLLGDLNPTPAVCGLPQFEASLFIAENEKMERRFYSGFIGMQWPSNNLELFVNLRCAELFNNHALLYAGAGITSGSNADNEWDETQRKLNTVKSLFET
jgi:isochorismate synthase